MPRLTDEQKEMYGRFCEEFTFCWACGWFGKYQEWSISRLVIAHIVGATGRRADRRDICRLCDNCHLLNHRNRIIVDGSQLPFLSLLEMVWLKQHFDHDFYDPKYLQSLRIQRAEVLIPEPLPEWFNLQREKSAAYQQWVASR